MRKPKSKDKGFCRPGTMAEGTPELCRSGTMPNGNAELSRGSGMVSSNPELNRGGTMARTMPEIDRGRGSIGGFVDRTQQISKARTDEFNKAGGPVGDQTMIPGHKLMAGMS